MNPEAINFKFNTVNSVNNYTRQDFAKKNSTLAETLSENPFKQAPSQSLSFRGLSAEHITQQAGLSMGARSFFKSLLKNAYQMVLNREIGQGLSNLINFGSKAVISPLVILGIGPYTGEKKESIRNAAILNPIQAGFALVTSFVASFAADKTFDKYAPKGTLFNWLDPELAKFFNSTTETGAKNLTKLKCTSAILITAAAIPLTSFLLNKILPKIINPPKGIPEKDKMLTTIYAQKLSPEFGNKSNQTNNQVLARFYA